MKAILKVSLVAALGVGLLACAGCVRRVPLVLNNQVSDSEQTAPLGGAAAIDLHVDQPAGELFVQSAATSETAVSGRFTYAPADLRPELSSSLLGGTRDVGVDSPNARPVNLPGGKLRNEWSLSVAPNVPANLTVTLGAGKGRLDLRGIELTGLDLQQGAGDVSVDLSGQSNTVDVRATLGAGKATFTVPQSARVRVLGGKDGIGSFNAQGFTTDGAYLVNDAYASSSATQTITISVQRGVGEVDIIEVP